jgi:tetratricopeptide (TPR) repeat protein
MRQRRTLTIRRDDHLEDGLGAIFFDPDEGNAPEILERLRAYLGPRLRVLRAEVSAKHAIVEVEADGFPQESERLRAEAEKLWNAGGRRAAMVMIRDAAALDVLSDAAAATLGVFLLESDAPEQALAELKRAREIGGDSASIRRNLARACIAMGRRSTAIAYLRAADELQPNDFQTLRMLEQLGYRKRPDSNSERSAGEAGPPRPSRVRRRRL